MRKLTIVLLVITAITSMYRAKAAPYNVRLDKAITDIARREEVSPQFLRSWVMVESSGLEYAARYEPAVARKRAIQDSQLSKTDRAAMATSHGPLQVMGYNAAACGMTWQDLHDPYKGIQCGVYHLKQWIKIHQSKQSTQIHQSKQSTQIHQRTQADQINQSNHRVQSPSILKQGLASYNGGYKGNLEYANKVLSYRTK